MKDLNRQLAELWGSRIDAFWFDLPGHRLELVAAYEREGVFVRRKIVLRGVRELTFSSRAVELPWLNAEITEATCGMIGEYLSLNMFFWSEENHLEVVVADLGITSY
jgi:hypothetical protein